METCGGLWLRRCRWTAERINTSELKKMHRPKKLANRVIDRWEQNLLLKVMQRKIKSAKSTIGGIQGIKKHQPPSPLSQKPRPCLDLYNQEWTFNDEEWIFSDVQHPDVTSFGSQIDLPSTSKVEIIEEPTKCSLLTSDPGIQELEEDILIARRDKDECLQDEGFMKMTQNFDDTFKDTDDDLLNELWSSCKKENSLLDNTPGLKPSRKVGSNSTATVFFLHPAPTTKLMEGKKKFPIDHFPLHRKTEKRNALDVSEFMKKRESGWRE